MRTSIADSRSGLIPFARGSLGFNRDPPLIHLPDRGTRPDRAGIQSRFPFDTLRRPSFSSRTSWDSIVIPL